MYSKDETGVAAWVVVSFTKWQVTQLRQNPFIMATVSSVSQTVATVELGAEAENMLQKIDFDSYISSIEINKIISN